MSLTLKAKSLTPAPVWRVLKTGRRLAARAVQRTLGLAGLNVARAADYYSPLPDLGELARTRAQWDRPSRLAGVRYDVPAMSRRLESLFQAFGPELAALPGYEQCVAAGFGPGYPLVDALTLYSLLREWKPKRYLEVGSGLSTYYGSLAAEANRRAGTPLEIHCIEPFPFPALRRIEGIRLTQQPVQEVPLATFERLEPGDVLFIDSSHALKIGGDVAYLFLEVLPALNDGVCIHIHDVPLPYNVPYPPDFWVFGQNWPIYWNEAMLVQAFLSFNERFAIHLSAPLVHHHDPSLLPRIVPGYRPPEGAGWFSSLWLVKQPART